jgi:hypothetical protein
MTRRITVIFLAVLAAVGIFLAARTETGRFFIFLLVTGGGRS